MASTSVKMTWNDKALLRVTEQAMAAGLREAGKHGRKAIRATLGGSAGSPEGGPPGKVSGRLQKAVAYKSKRRAGRYVLVDVGILRRSPQDRKYPGEMHAMALRLSRGYVGTDRKGRTYSQGARPFIEPVLAAERQAMANIVQKKASAFMPKTKVKG